jgi:hypothetical protein
MIDRHIAEHGFHVYLVQPGRGAPRFLYTIGLTPVIGTELVLPGAVLYDAAPAGRVINEVGERLRAGASASSAFELGDLGAFTLREARHEWVQGLLLGALDYYPDRTVRALQIAPDERHWTVDVPRFDEPPSAPSNRAWRWLHEDWPFPVPRESEAMVDLPALRGQPLSEAARWEEDYWECSAGRGDEVEKADARLLPLGVLLGSDDSLIPLTRLEVGHAAWRDEASGGWRPWGAPGR